MDIGLEEIETAANLVTAAAHPEALIIFGAMFDEKMDDEMRVTVIATRFDDKPRPAGLPSPLGDKMPGAGLFTEAVEKKEAETKPAPEPPQEEDPFDTIFKIFNSK
jgi:cell division protein FtsZ